ncbi:MAG: ATP-dependent Clp protease ATP-binding subunit ClpA, partial [Alphaproteobacteria bacterium]|nr:ATP-dependent Clp protease ATP-binding subunit ClpA [Alphaproteobacteria bacterium]
MLSRHLEHTLHQALGAAGQRRHEYATLEHLLWALLADQDAVAVLRACGIGINILREQIESYLNHDLSYLINPHVAESKPTTAFQRVLQRAAIHVQSSGREEVTGANVL